jgi:curli production assembly/transport component CsgG
MIVLAVIVCGCGVLTPSLTSSPAVAVQEVSLARWEVNNLPEPAGKMTATVYRFSDSTGQRKEGSGSGIPATYSTAVPQDLVPVLMEVLAESGWFITVERQGMQHLVTEKQAVGNTKGLLPAQVIIEGAITGYDTNVRTGGFGLSWLGIIPKTQFFEDVVTVSVRVINAADGRMFQSATVTKRVMSKELRTGVFKFLETNRLLEGDAGYTRNEVVSSAVREALERALVDIIVQGVIDENWKPKDPDYRTSAVVRLFLERNRGRTERFRQIGEQVHKRLGIAGGDISQPPFPGSTSDTYRIRSRP